MSFILEHRAYCAATGRFIHFLDRSWKKNRKWKIYLGYTRDDIGDKKELCLKVPVKDVWDEKYCDLTIKSHEEIKKLAVKFNKIVSNGSKIRVIVPDKAIINRTAGVHVLKRKKRFLSRGEWILVFEKIGKTLEDFVRTDGTSDDEVMQAFLHFTYHESGGRFVVSKIRGVRSDSMYVLSCSSIHDTDNKIMRVMKNHTCNSICRGFQMSRDLRHSSTETMSIDIPQEQPSAPPPMYSSECPKGHRVVYPFGH